MSANDKSLSRYDEYVPMILADKNATAPNWPVARLFLHLLEENHTATNSVKFRKVYLPEADAFYHTDYPGQGKASNDKTVSPDFVQAFIDILAKIGDASNNADNKNDISNQVRGKTLPGFMTNALQTIYGAGYQNDKTNYPDNSGGVARVLDTENIFDTTIGWKPAYANGTAHGNDLLSPLGGTSAVKPLVAGSGIVNASYAGNGNYLPYALDKLYLKQTLENHFKNSQSTTGTTTESSFFDVKEKSSAVDEKLFYRKVGEPNVLYMKVENGTDVAVQAGSKKFLELTANNNCYTTGLKDSYDCNTFITKCLNGTDVQACKQYMEDASFNQYSENDIKNMNPDMALTMLKSFRVPIKSVYVESIGMSLDMVASTGEWIEHLKNNHQGTSANQLKPDEIEKIAKQSSLRAHLDRMIKKINANPAILNKNYTGGSLESDPNAFVGTTFSKYGMKPKQYNVNPSAPNMSSVLAIRNTVIANRNYVSGIYGVPIIGFMQRGGAELKLAMQEQEGGAAVQINAAGLLERQFDAFLANLKAHNKALDANDTAHVKSLIGELKTLEQKLNKASEYTDKYMKLIGVFGQQHNATIFDLNNLQKFVDKRNNYFERVNKKQDSLFDILSALANANQKETTQETSNVSANPDWARLTSN